MRLGGRLVPQLWTTGEDDVITMFEAPDDETAVSLALQVSSLGNVRITTVRAFTADELPRTIATSKS